MPDCACDGMMLLPGNIREGDDATKGRFFFFFLRVALGDGATTGRLQKNLSRLSPDGGNRIVLQINCEPVELGNR